MQHPSVDLVSCELTDSWQTFSGTSETRPNAQNAIRFIALGRDGEALVDDVVVVPAEK